ncbi:ion transporter [Loigolactobacillus backii]|nr:ion transporter [Loigolactobacillus backii]
MVLLAVISIVLVVLDCTGTVSLASAPWGNLDNIILVIFAIDYFSRLLISKNKWQFLKENIFDLIAIIPFNSVFSIFRIARITRIFRLLRFIRLLGLTGKLQHRLRTFFYTNGLIYLIWTSAAILLLSSFLYSIAEKVPFSESLWWAIATATTVGYGDISPHTAIGKLAAVLLMFVGIGFIGMLTSTIMTYFTNQDSDNDDKLDKMQSELDIIKQQNEDLKNEIRKLTK